MTSQFGELPKPQVLELIRPGDMEPSIRIDLREAAECVLEAAEAEADARWNARTGSFARITLKSGGRIEVFGWIGPAWSLEGRRAFRFYAVLLRPDLPVGEYLTYAEALALVMVSLQGESELGR